MGISVVHAQGVEGTDYRKIEPPLPTTTPGKIEVIEFFSYMCPHCKEFYPWSVPGRRSYPRTWCSDACRSASTDRRGSTSRALTTRCRWSGDLDRLDEALFRAIHDEHLQLFDASSLTDWVGKSGGHAEQFAAAYASFGVNNQTGAGRSAGGQVSRRRRSDHGGQRRVSGDGQEFPPKILANTDRLIAQVQTEARAKGTPKHP